MKYKKKPVVIEAVRWTGDNMDEVIGEAYHVEAKDGKADVAGMVSRKKQLLPQFASVISTVCGE